MSLSTFFNRVRLLVAAHLTSGEDLVPDENTSTGGVMGAIERLGSGAVDEAEKVGGDVVQKVETVATDVIAEARTVLQAGKVDALALIASLGGIHTSLGSFTLSDEIAAARTAVEQAIVSIAKHFAQMA